MQIEDSIENDDLICHKCNKTFDNENHIPRMLPTCGHTICQ